MGVSIDGQWIHLVLKKAFLCYDLLFIFLLCYVYSIFVLGVFITYSMDKFMINLLKGVLKEQKQ